MLINMRNAMMTGKRLPNDAEVEWLGAFNGPYIDTAVLSATDVSMEVEAAFEWDQLSTESSYGSYFGCNAAGSAGAVFVGFTADKTSLRAYFGSSSGTQQIQIPINSSFNTFFCSKDVSRINEQSSIMSGTPSINSPLSIFLFKNNVSWAGGGARPKCRIKYAKFHKGSTLVRDYIPVRRGAVGYMYDRVSGKLFGNDGTGAFIIGPDKSAANRGGGISANA